MNTDNQSLGNEQNPYINPDPVTYQQVNQQSNRQYMQQNSGQYSNVNMQQNPVQYGNTNMQQNTMQYSNPAPYQQSGAVPLPQLIAPNPSTQLQNNTLGNVSAVLGIICLCASCIGGGVVAFISLLLGIIAVSNPEKKHGSAVTGIVSSILAILILVPAFIYWFA